MMELDPIKVVKCKECGVDVVVNANYPITEVECSPRYCPKPANLEADEKIT
mgnify:FL=1|tara:strand:+ start:1168 stop:1320 length:153 start_codon:yes stop_codon:yes gene_type:complete